MKESPSENSTLLKEDAPPAEGALDDAGPVDIWAPHRRGYLLQYFTVGIVYGGLPATTYGVFIAYLNVPSYVANASSTLATLPWSLKIGFALLTDMLPIAGYRRRPYMVLGWMVCTTFLLILAGHPLPSPYYCQDENGDYDLTAVCNEAAATAGMPYAILMACAAIGYVQADVAADALTVQYGRREPRATRGQTQTTAYMVRECGMIVSRLLVGIGMNGKAYNGTFRTALSFNAVCGIMAIPSAIMIPVSWYYIEEPKIAAHRAQPLEAADPPEAPSKDSSATRQGEGKGGEGKGGEGKGGEAEIEPMSMREYGTIAMRLLSSVALFEVLCYLFFTNVIAGISTTAGNEVQRVWADVQQLQLQLFAIGGNLLFLLGLYLVKTRFLHASWRAMTAITLLLMTFVDVPFTMLTVFNVVRNQYFFLDDGLITSLPNAANFVISTYVMVEIAEPGTEGVTYGLLTTAANLGGPVASCLSNWIFGYFHPSLSSSDNYAKDLPPFRALVAWSYFLSYALDLLSLTLLPLLPNQKEEAQERKARRPRAYRYAVASVTLIAAALIYALVVDFLGVIPATQCLQIVGGPGCDR